MHIHILGVCGTFMGGIAALATEAGHRVTGSDRAVYPPMSTQLEAAGVTVWEGYDPDHLRPAPDAVVVGNAMSRGNPVVEYMLDAGLHYTSGPQWLAEHVLRDRWVVAVAGTHGKTTTASMLAWILDRAGLQPGFLIGGVPEDFGISARLGEGRPFVVEADEYDTAFFDKRSKFIHYRPRTLVLGNLEYDHADIFDDLSAIQRQFHHLVRTVPGTGQIIANGEDEHLEEVLAMGRWTAVERFGVGRGADWQAAELGADDRRWLLYHHGDEVGTLVWDLMGRHNAANAMAAVAAAAHVGVTPDRALMALGQFRGVKRRMQLRAQIDGVSIYDDFAHHPTAIATTLAGLRARTTGRIIAVLEPRSNTMRMGVHRQQLAVALAAADHVLLYRPEGLQWEMDQVLVDLQSPGAVHEGIDDLLAALMETVRAGDQVVIMSNGSFGGLHDRLAVALSQRRGADMDHPTRRTGG